jgi:hypothetical protein
MMQVNGTDSIQNKTWPVFDDEMVEAAVRVLQSGKVTYWYGSEGQRFEVARGLAEAGLFPKRARQPYAAKSIASMVV